MTVSRQIDDLCTDNGRVIEAQDALGALPWGAVRLCATLDYPSSAFLLG